MLLVWLLLSFVVSAHVVDKSGSVDQVLKKEYSLLDLVHSTKLPPQWEVRDSAILEEGRIVMTPKKGSKGSVWLKPKFQTKDSFTVDFIFRSINYSGKSEGGMSFWLLDSKSETTGDFHSGPSKYDGLQILLDNQSKYGPSLHNILNDGSMTITQENVYNSAFSSCLMAYQESTIPFTLRLTYSARQNNLLKLQIDNKVCFQTRNIQLQDGDYRIGVSADNGKTDESFELLLVKVYDDVLNRALEPNLKAMPQPKTVQKIINKNTGTSSLREKDIFDSKKSNVGVMDIYKKMNKLEGKVLSNDNSKVYEMLEVLNSEQKKMLSALTELSSALSRLKDAEKVTLKSKGNAAEKQEYSEFTKMNTKLAKVLAEQQEIRNLHKNQQILVDHSPELLNRFFWWLAALVILILVLAYHTYKIQQEISKTKIL
ncbi:Protein EMP47 [Nakaseomyces bracarensis]|uniref:Protein EMP47 n=1 Tax=Nakaseomyces bracarensis TaxID=273131 RepID=A0ABR4NPB3_9SACH